MKFLKLKQKKYLLLLFTIIIYVIILLFVFDYLLLEDLSSEKYIQEMELNYINVIDIKDFFYEYVDSSRPIFNKEKNTTTKRIVLVGDSVAYGLHVDFNQTFGYLLELQLNNFFNEDFEVINLAVPGYNLNQVLRVFEEQLFDYQPDMIIFVTFHNDWLLNNYKEGVFFEYSIFIPKFHFFLYDSLISKSNIYKKIMFLLGKILPNTFERINLGELEAENSLIKIITLSNKKEIPLLIINSPNELEILLQPSDYERWFNSILSEQKKIVFNLRKPLMNYQNQSLFLDTAHYNPQGHKIVADIIMDYLLNNSFV